MALIKGLGKFPRVPQKSPPFPEMSRKAKGTHSRGGKRDTAESGYVLAVPQDVTEMGNAILRELHCPGGGISSRGKAYLMGGGGVMAHQAGRHC